MRTQLHIGEVAQLLDITPKAIRHYQKIGLLAEPERTQSGYRLYNAQDLLRLQRIRRLQSFGLSLKQIKTVLGDHKSEHTLRDVLQALEGELGTQIEALEERRRKIRILLEEDTLNEKVQLLATSPSFQIVQEQLAPYHADISEAFWEQEAYMYALLDTFQRSPGHQDEMQKVLVQMTQYFTEHTDEYQQLIALGERFVAIAPLAADAPEVQQLANDFLHYFAHHSFLWTVQQQESYPETPFIHIATAMMKSQFSPSQLTVMNVLTERMKDKQL